MHVLVNHNGEKVSLSKLSQQTGLKYKTLYARLFTKKWRTDIAINTPLTTPRAYKKILEKETK